MSTAVQIVNNGRRRNVKEPLNFLTGWMQCALLHVADAVGGLVLKSSLAKYDFIIT